MKNGHHWRHADSGEKANNLFVVFLKDSFPPKHGEKIRTKWNKQKLIN